MNEDRNLVRSAAQTLQRVVGEYLGGQPDHDLRWQIIIIIGRYTSHIAIILVAIIAVLLAGARLNVTKVTPEPIPNNPSSIVSRPDGAINPANESNILSQNIPNRVFGAGNIPNSRDLFALYSQQNYATLANQDDGLLTRFALPQTIKQIEELKTIFTYTVQPGDTVEGLSTRFGLEPATLAWSNEEVEEDPDHLSLGQILNILPVDGVYYKVQSGDTLDSIAKKFKAKVEDIVGMSYNNLGNGANVVAGTQIIVVNGVKPLKPRIVELPIAASSQGQAATPRANTGAAAPQAFAAPRAATGIFSYPLTGYILSQNFWWGHPGLDMAINSGTPIRAADNGYVQFSGWSTVGYGNLVVIEHEQGFSTRYGHLQKGVAKVGQRVNAGDLIALLGNTGRSTGAHLHFEVRKNDQALNPFPFIRESRADVFQQARNGRGKDLLAQYRQGLQKGTARR